MITQHTWLLFVFSIVLMFVACSSLRMTAPESEREVSKKETPYNAWDEVLQNTETIEGFLRFHKKRDRTVLLELRPDQLDREFGLNIYISQGVGSIFLPPFRVLRAGWPMNEPLMEVKLMRFERIGDNIQIVRTNPRFTAEPESPEFHALQKNVAHSIIGTFEIESKHEETGNFLIDMTDFLVSDFGNFEKGLQSVYGNAAVNLDQDRSYVDQVQGFPENAEVDVNLTYSTSGSPQQPAYAISDHRSVPIGVRYSFFKLPEESMQPRYADLRVGYFVTAVMDMSRDQEPDRFVRYINRWRLEKKDHSLEVSEPVEPIVLYIDHSVPDEYRSYVREGIEAWNKAFETAGYRNAIVAKDAPDDPSWSTEDARYSAIRWDVAPGAMGGYGPSHVDPRTGEILKGSVLINMPFLTYWNKQWAEFIAEGLMNGGFSEIHREHETLNACFAQAGMVPHLGLKLAALAVFGKIQLDEPTPETFIGDAIRELVMHEVGHTLGLYHNFKSSSTIPHNRLNDKDFTRNYGITGSVMDYTPPNIALDPDEQGHYWNPGVGPYDTWAIKYGYAPVYEQDTNEPFARRGELVTDPDAERIGLRKIADRSTEPFHAYDELHSFPAIDPRTNSWSLGDDPLRFAEDRLTLVDMVESELDRILIRPGEGYELLREAFSWLWWLKRVSLQPAVTTIGGLYVERDHKETPGARPPFDTIPAWEKRRALQLIIDNAFATEAIRSESELINKLVASRWTHWGMRGVAWAESPAPLLDYQVHEEAAQFQERLLSQLFDPYRLARIIDYEVRVEPDEELLTLGEYFDRISSAIWDELDNAIAIDSFRRNLQRLHIKALSQLILNDELPGVSPSPSRPRTVPGDARSLARWELDRLSTRIQEVLVSPDALDKPTHAHLVESSECIERVLEASVSINIGR